MVVPANTPRRKKNELGAGKSVKSLKFEKPANPAKPLHPSPVSNIGVIGSLKRYPDKEYANSILHEVAKLVAPIIHENNFKVGTLCEMFPKNPNLLGLNVNRGQKILLRLRYHSNDRSFYPIGDIVETFLHELTHNLFGPHDEKFYAFLDGLRKRFDQIQIGNVSTSGYRCEEGRLGRGYNPKGGFVSVREQRIKELSKPKYKAEARRLGGSVDKIGDPRKLREAMLQAVERRMKDNKWCHSNLEEIEAQPAGDELDVVEVDDTAGTVSPPQTEQPAQLAQPDPSNPFLRLMQYKEVIDLTSDEIGEPRQPDKEIIVIDACEDNHTSEPPKSILRLGSGSNDTRRVKFTGLLPSFDDDTISVRQDESEDDGMIKYTSSSSPKSYFGNDNLYPRRKLVADLNFDQIIRKSKKIHVEERVVVSDRIPKKSPKKASAKKLPEKTIISRKEKEVSKTSKKKKHTKSTESRPDHQKPTNHRKTVRSITFKDLL